MAATVGALRVVLGADTAAFSKGLKQSEQRLSGFAGAVKKAGPIIGAAIGTAVVALGVAIKRTINDADALSKTSQKIGVPVEELSRLRHAAEISGVSFETLTKGVQRFSRNIFESAQGLATPTKAFKALDIEIKNSDGSLKSVSEALPEIADRFSRMRDGTEKTALAMQLFGRAGAELIPMLNLGAEGVRNLMNEADELGIVLTTEAARAAEEFNDNLNRINKLGQGLVIGIVNDWTPALADLSKIMLDASKATKELSGELGALVGQEVAVTTFFDTVEAAARRLMNPIGAAIQGFKTLKALALEGAGSGTEVTLDVTPPPPEAFEPAIESQKELAAASKAAKDAIAEQNAIQREAEMLLYSIATPAQAYQNDLAEISRLHQLGAIDATQYQQALSVAAERAGATWGQASESIAGSFAHIGRSFGRESSKMAKAGQAFGAVQALISTYTGMAKALELPFPANLAAMAAVAARGFGVVASIRSQNIPAFATGGSFKVGGSGGIDSQLIQFKASPGEMVDIKKPGNDNSGTGHIKFNIINQTRTDVRADSRPGTGGADLDLVIEEVVNSNLGRGRHDRVLGDRFGMSRRTVVR